MTASDDPVALLPLAMVGLVIGAGLALGCGYGLHLRWSGPASATTSTAHVRLEGRVAWAGWRASAARGGPDWYLQVRLAGHPRDFLVAASSLTEQARGRYDAPTGRAPGASRRIPGLEGRRATVVVDSSLLARPAAHPYLSALRVDGETVVPLDESRGGGPGWGGWAVVLLLGVGVLAGVGLFGGAVQHLVVCVRHRRGAA